MDDYRLQRMTAEKVSKRFGSHQVLYSRYVPQIPESAEREYVRTANAYMRILKEELEEELPKLKEAYKANRDEEVRLNRRNDSATDLMLAITQIFNAVKNNVIARTAGFGLRRKLENLAHLNRKLTVKEWKRAIKATLGIDIREDYYLGDFYVEQLEKWVSDNVDLIRTIPEDTLEKMKDIVYDGFTNGKTTTRMVKEMQRAYGISRRRAELIARDQTAKLNGQIQKAQQQDAGITEYIWCTTGDERVRRSHRDLNGKKFSWDVPPVNSDGRRCHPGEDFQCRCIGRPVFDRNKINLPMVNEVSASATSKVFAESKSPLQNAKENVLNASNHISSNGTSGYYVYSENDMRAKYAGAYFDRIGYNAKPEVVDEKMFDSIESKYAVQYRGVTSKEYADQFLFGERFVGSGANGHGNNSTYDLATALEYANENPEGSTVMKMKISSDAKVILDNELMKKIPELRGALSSNMNDNEIIKYLMNDPGCLAAAFGYDAILDSKTGWLNVVNRSKLVISNKYIGGS